MPRIGYSLAVVVTALSQPFDPAFSDIPFDDWLKGGDDVHIGWSLRVLPVELSEHQRLETSVMAYVDGSELAKRSEPGRLVLFMEIRDSAGHAYRSHRALTIKSTTNPEDLRDVRSGERISVLPGDFEIAAAVYDSKTHEHSLKRAKLHVPPMAHDPLSGVWKDLPQLELLRRRDPPPHLALRVRPEKPLRIEVVANAAVNRDRMTGRLAPSFFLTPRLQVISQIEIAGGSMHLTVLNVERRAVTLNTNVATARNLFSSLSRAMSSGDQPYRMSVRGLEGYKEDAQFFVTQIQKRLETPVPEAGRVLIVLSGALEFPKDVDQRPIQTAAAPDRVYYIRCKASAAIYMVNNADSLERTLEPLHPKLFDVTTPLDFRRALATIMREVSEGGEARPKEAVK